MKAWAKLNQFLHKKKLEVSGFGIAEDPEDLLLVTDFITVPQVCGVASTEMDDEGVAAFHEKMAWERELKHDQFLRIWIHTHPGDSAQPSSMDEETFAKEFGSSTWSVMMILAKGGNTYARLKYNVGPGGYLELPVRYLAGSRLNLRPGEEDEWDAEYEANVKEDPAEKTYFSTRGDHWYNRSGSSIWDRDDPLELDDDDDEGSLSYYSSPIIQRRHSDGTPYRLALSGEGDVFRLYGEGDKTTYVVLDDDDPECEEFWQVWAKELPEEAEWSSMTVDKMPLITTESDLYDSTDRTRGS